jgi:5-enolpyruvylshikimate-3-phosphate synthase
VERPERNVFRVPLGRYKNPSSFNIEPDATALTYDIACSVLLRRPITINDIGSTSCQGDINFIDVLQKMGASIEMD